MATPTASDLSHDGGEVTVRPGSRADPRRPILIALMMTMAISALDTTVVTTAVPSVVRDLGGFTLFPWLFSIYLLTQAVTVPIYGRAADLFGRKPVLTAGIVIFLVGSVLCGFAWNMESLIAFRGLQGLGAGAIIPIVQTVVGDIYSVKERARVTGYTASVWGVSAVVGPLIGGIFSQYVSWRWIFFVNLPIGLYAMVLLARHLRESVVRTRHKIDGAGSVTLTIGLATLILALLQGGSSWAWGSARELTVIGVGVVSLAAFVVVERRAEEPMLPLWIFQRRPLLIGSVTSMVVGAILLGMTSYIPSWAQGVRHADPIVAGLTVATITLGWPLAASLSGRIYLRFGFRAAMFIGGSIAVIGCGLFVTLGSSTSLVVAGAFGFVAGFGLGLIATPALVGVQSLVGWERRGVVTAANLFARTVGSAVGIAIFGSIANSSLAHWVAAAPPRVAAGLSGSANVTSGVLGGGKIDLPAADAAYVRVGLQHATHSVFIAIAVVALLGLLAVFAFPSRLGSIDHDGTTS